MASALAMLIGPGVGIQRVDLAAGIDSPDLQNVAAVEPEPTANEYFKPAALSLNQNDGANNPDRRDNRDGDEPPESPVARLSWQDAAGEIASSWT